MPRRSGVLNCRSGMLRLLLSPASAKDGSLEHFAWNTSFKETFLLCFHLDTGVVSVKDLP